MGLRPGGITIQAPGWADTHRLESAIDLGGSQHPACCTLRGTCLAHRETTANFSFAGDIRRHLVRSVTVASGAALISRQPSNSRQSDHYSAVSVVRIGTL